MNKGKQTTLFQSWGPKKHTNTDVPYRSTEIAVFDLCSDDDDEDDILAQVADETLNLIENYGNPSRSTDNRPSTSTSTSPGQTSPGATDVCNISLGADSFSTTPGLTQMEVPEGYDRSAGKLWIYPTNYPVRDYQYNIVHQALFKNTMVTLPTGLGKTFIASVVMYNFYRWYPQGKVIFMAPTKPLVAQQIEACYNIMGIPQHDTAEMTGNMAPTERRKVWHSRRVFFLTPQVLTNDLSRGTCPAELVKCLVIDEAHKAQGNHAYCQVVRELIKYTKNFRILALSATPGSDIKAVQQVLVNLLISHIELRTEDSIDIKQYSHERKVEKIVVPLGDELIGVRNKYLQIVDLVVNRLKRQGVLYARNTTSLSKFLILKARDAFRQNPPQQLPQAQYGVVEGDFALAMSLYHGLELLQLHGQRSLYNFLDGIVSGEKSYGRTRTELMKNCNFTELMQVLGEKFAPTDVRMSQVPASQRKPFLAGHPKMLKLEEVVLNHFNTINKDNKTEGMVATRIMIFSQYRDSVTEITDMLKQHRPMVKAMSFIGQSSAGKATKGFTQKEQLKVMKEFREGGYNTLVSTCVGEEGLDIGEVDLIICFDAHKSPIRLVQRMGRTGRKREGRIVMLVTEGKEEQIYNQSQYSKKNIHKAILNGAKSLQFYNGNPRMVPEGWNPSCHKMYITVTQSFKATKQVSENKAVEKKMTNAAAQREKKKSDCDGLLSDMEAKELESRLGGIKGRKVPQRKPLLSLGESWDQDEPRESTLSLTEWLPWQNRLQPTHFVQHSKKAKDFVELMQFIELQGHQDSKEDTYGNEMRIFLVEDDILKDGESDAEVNNGRKKSDGEDCRRIRKPSKQDGRKKVRRSEKLPKFESDEGSDSDKSLPAVDFCGKSVNNEGNGPMSKESECEEIVMEDEIFGKDDKSENKKISGNNQRKDATEICDVRNEDIVSAVVINKEISVKIEKQRIKRKSSIAKGTKSSNSIKGFLTKNKRSSIAKNIEKSKTKNAISRTVVEIIDDDDTNDFETSGPSTILLEEKRQEEDLKEVENTEISSESNTLEVRVDKVKECRSECGEENATCCDRFSEILPDFVSSDCQHDAPLLENLEGCMESIPSPPSLEEVTAQTECLKTLQQLPPLDLLQLVDEWEKENRHRLIRNERNSGDFVTEERIEHDSCKSDSSENTVIATRFTSVVTKTLASPFQSAKVSVPIQDIHVDRAVGQPTLGRKNAEMIGKMKDIVNSKINEDNDNIGSDSDDSDTAMLPSQANFALCTEVLMPDVSETVKEQANRKDQSSNKEKIDEIDGEISMPDRLVTEHQNKVAALKESEPECSTNSSDEDEFMDTQATFMLASTADFLMTNNTENEIDENIENKIDKKDNTLNCNNSTCNQFETKSSDNLSNTCNGRTKQLKSVAEKRESDIQQSGVLCSAQSKNSDSSETHFTFTQALACVHDSEEILGENNTEIQEVGTHIEPIVSNPQNEVSQKFDSVSAEENKTIRSDENNFEKHKADKISKSDEGTSVKAMTKNTFSDSSDDDFDLIGDVGASFDLGFNVDEDIIPPSPCASQSLSQKSFTRNLSQSLLRSRRSLVPDLGQSLSIISQRKVSPKSVMEAISEIENVDLGTSADVMDMDRSSDDADENNLTDFVISDITQERSVTSSSNRKIDTSKSKSNADIGNSRNVLHIKTDETSSRSRKDMSPGDSEKFSQIPSANSDLGGRVGQIDDSKLEGKVGFDNQNDMTSRSKVIESESVIAPHENNASETDFTQDDMHFEEQLALAIEESLKSAAKEFSHDSPKGRLNTKPSDCKTETNPQNIDDAESPSSDLNDSFIVRKKRKVASIDSPVTPQSSTIEGNKFQDEFKTPLKPPDFQHKRKAKSHSSLFEEGSIIKNKKKHIVSFNIPDISSDEDDFDLPVVKKKDDIGKKPQTKKISLNVRKSKSPADDFFDEEAEVSGEDESDDDYEGSELDHYEDSFVGEATQMSQRTAEEMQAVYLKSVRSPRLHMAGKFKLKYGHSNIDVFSQPPPEEESEYLHDSFCVGDEEEEDSFIADDSDLGEVTLLQDVSCEGRRTRWSKPAPKQHVKKSSKKVAKGRRRIQALNDSSSEEDIPNANSSEVVEDDFQVRGKKGGARAILSSSASSDDGLNTDMNSHSPSSSVLSLKSRIQRKKENHSDAHKDDTTFRSVSNLNMTTENRSIHQQNARSDRELRLQRQREKQEEFRRKMINKDNTSDKKEMTDFKESDNESTWLAKPIRECNPDNKIIVIVDSREINGSQDIISDLRFQYKCHVIAAQLESCDYIISNRMCVDRKQWSEFSNGANREKLVERIQGMVELYERPCLIIEKDRVKGDEKGVRPLHWTKYVDKTLVQLVQSKVTLFFAENQKETVTLISDLCSLEKRKNMTISVPVDLKSEKQEQLRFYTSIPKLTYVNALNLCHNFSTVTEFVNSSAHSIKSRGCMNIQKATDVFNYLRRTFDSQMVPNSKTR